MPEPGCLFWSTIQRCSISDAYPGMAVVSTNPCGEEPLEEYGDCCLGSLNLAACVVHPFTPQATVDVAAVGARDPVYCAVSRQRADVE